MPKAGMAMEEGKIIRWFVGVGEKVENGAPLLEIETDKVNMEVEATASGTLLKILAGEGDVVPVTQVIGYIGTPGEAVDEAAPVTAEKKTEAKAEEKPASLAAKLDRTVKVPATPLAKSLARQQNIRLGDLTASGYYGEIKARDVKAARVKATPLAKKMAEEANISLGDVKTQESRIFSKDIKALIAQPQKAVPAMDGDVAKPLNGMRKTIAARMLESHIQIPPVTMDTKADVTGLLLARKKQNEKHKVSINDYVVQACAQALSEMPQMNVSFAGDSLMFHSHINIGVAVSLDGGLIVPVIRNADRYSLEGIADTVKELAGKARAGKLLPDEYTGGTFTISNLGKYGITFFTPIINEPESMILGVCAVEKVLKMEEGHLFNRDIMGLSLTFDHRTHDGVSAAVLLQRIVELLESVGQGGIDG
jgi:pyruvate dehydrogenase E2 component (dihydrolipoamide acetyltransferase)